MKRKIWWITETAIMLALLVTLQALTKGFGQLVTGSFVNVVLAVSVLVGGWSIGLTVALISPVLAFLLNIAPMALTVPAIMAGNAVYEASLVAGAGLLLIYAGLTYLGATAQALPNTRLTRIELLVALVQAILPGKMGMVFFGVIAALACLTTAIALTSAAGKYFAELTRGRVGYRMWVAAICAFSAGVSGIGVERLVELASPILGVVYPPVLALVLLSFVGKQNAKWLYRLPAGAAMMMGLLETMGTTVVERLPLAGLGLAWVMPACLSAAMGYILDHLHEKTLPSA